MPEAGLHPLQGSSRRPTSSTGSRLGGEFGLTNSEGIGLDPVSLGKRRDAVVDKHVQGVEFLLKNAVTVLRGHGVLTGPTSVESAAANRAAP